MAASDVPGSSLQGELWWSKATFYQIWPASYKDSNGDGLGDIQGIISTLDYLKDLGVDAIWLSPIYDSPQIDMGYDVKDYEAVYRPYGTLDDVDALIKGCHDRGIRLLLDLCVTYTSDQHAWFQESKSSKDNPKREWYIWRPPKYVNGQRQPPNNWRASWGGSTWEWDEATQEYYFHLYSAKQPDLNWDNKDLREAVYQSAVKFWLDRGIDGFRIDTVGKWSKDASFPDAEITDPDSSYQFGQKYHSNLPSVHTYLEELRNRIKTFTTRDILIVGELGYIPNLENDAAQYISQKELDLVFLFDILMVGKRPSEYGISPFTLPELKDAVAKIQAFASRRQDGSNSGATIFLENHDQPRSISRFGYPDYYHSKSGKLLAMFLLSLTGSLFLYQGQEIGMTNVPKDWRIEDFKDIAALEYYNEAKEKFKNDENKLREVLREIQLASRDNARTPIQWSAESPNAGFTTPDASPWIRINENYPSINVARQKEEKHSILTTYKEMIGIRKKYADAFASGTFEVLDEGNESTFMFTKTSRDAKQKAFVVLNFTTKAQPLQLLRVEKGQRLKFLIGNEVDVRLDNCLLPYEGRVYLVEKEAEV